MKQIQGKEKGKLYGKWIFTIEDTITGKKRTIEKKNILPTVGRIAMAKQLAGLATKDMGDNLYIAVGDDNTTPTITDTKLGNETTRKAVSSTTTSSVTSIITVFFAAGEATDTHEEFGLFGDGNTTTASASADSGVLYSHVAQTVIVSATETLTAEFQIEFGI